MLSSFPRHQDPGTKEVQNKTPLSSSEFFCRVVPENLHNLARRDWKFLERSLKDKEFKEMYKVKMDYPKGWEGGLPRAKRFYVTKL